MSKLPGYDKGAFLIDYMNVTEYIENDRLEAKRIAEE